MNNNIHNNIQRLSNFLVVLKPANKPHHFQFVITNKWLHCDFPDPVHLWGHFHNWIYLLLQRRTMCPSGTEWHNISIFFSWSESKWRLSSSVLIGLPYWSIIAFQYCISFCSRAV